MNADSIFVWGRTWLTVVPLYLAEGCAGVKWRSGNETHLRSNGNSVISREMSLKGCEAHRYDTQHSEAVAAALRKSVSTQGLLYCGFQQAVAC